jgi:hypothetical protein
MLLGQEHIQSEIPLGASSMPWFSIGLERHSEDMSELPIGISLN